jgi:hypothetical protein
VIEGSDDLLGLALEALVGMGREVVRDAEPRRAMFLHVEDEDDDTVPHGAETPPDTWEISDESAWQSFVDETVDGDAADER